MEQTNGTGNPSRAVIISTPCAEADLGDHVGQEGYPYGIACRSFAPLVARWACTREVTRPESRLDHALWRARRNQQEPLHLSFLPLHSTYLSPRAPNLAFAFSEFPDIPQTDLADNPRNNYVSLANRLALLVTPNSFSRQAFVRGGVQTPIHLVPVPISSAYFDLPVWEPGQRTVLDCPCYLFPQPEGLPAVAATPWAPAERGRLGLRGGVRQAYKNYVRPRIGAGLDRYLTLARRVVASARASRAEEVSITYPVSPRLELSGVVYTTILNALDSRENWQDVLSAFLLALDDRENACLLVKLAAHPSQAAAAFNQFLGYYRKLGLRHRCKLAVVTTYLSESQMVELAGASTYYVQATRAEGLGLPLQNYLAAGRPGISPAHTAMADYFDDEVGFVVAAHSEPASWPQDPAGRHTTTWYRLVWQALADHFHNSYVIAEQNQALYRALADRARQRLRSWASAESVWPRLAAALNTAVKTAERHPLASEHPACAVIAKAS
jgi:glycosyltransferase involved in cell wall biosynthesis